MLGTLHIGLILELCPRYGVMHCLCFCAFSDGLCPFGDVHSCLAV